MSERFEIKVQLIKNIPFVLDAVLEIGFGVILIIGQPVDSISFIIGVGFITLGTVQLIRKIKSFYLTSAELIIKRPLFPFRFMEDRFQISKLKGIEFIRVKGRFGGPHLNVTATDKSESFRIELTKEKIDKFEAKLKSLGIQTIRNGL